MKNIIFALFVMLFYFPSISQEESLVSGKIESGGYGGVFAEIGQINRETGIFIGGQGVWLINHRFGLGGKGYGIVNEIKIEGLENTKLEFGCGGALLEYTFASEKLVHVNIQSLIGAGSVKYSIIDYTDNHGNIDYTADNFFVLEPGLNVDLNVYKSFRIGAGVTYRYLNGVDYENLSNSDLSGISGQVILKFGTF